MLPCDTRKRLAALASAALVGVIVPTPAADATKHAARAVEEADAAAAANAERQWTQSAADRSTRRLKKVRSARENAQRAAARAERELRGAREGLARTRAAIGGVSEPTGRHGPQHALDSPAVRRHSAAVFRFLEARAEREAARSALDEAERAQRRVVKELKVEAEATADAATEPEQAMLTWFAEAAKKAWSVEKRGVEEREAEKREAAKQQADKRANAARTTSRSTERARPGTGDVTSSYGMRTHPVTGVEKLHSGTDFDDGDGNAYAADSGTVEAVTHDGGYGNMVTVNHGGGVQTRYAHLAEPTVKVGQRVGAGAVVGRIGSTGNSTGTHLHFEVLLNGDFTNPVAWLDR